MQIFVSNTAVERAVWHACISNEKAFPVQDQYINLLAPELFLLTVYKM